MLVCGQDIDQQLYEPVCPEVALRPGLSLMTDGADAEKPRVRAGPCQLMFCARVSPRGDVSRALSSEL